MEFPKVVIAITSQIYDIFHGIEFYTIYTVKIWAIVKKIERKRNSQVKHY